VISWFDIQPSPHCRRFEERIVRLFRRFALTWRRRRQSKSLGHARKNPGRPLASADTGCLMHDVARLGLAFS
jgi:hypothetical protein